jgi:hypothetical protein
MHPFSCPHCEFIFLGDDLPQDGCPACGGDWGTAPEEPAVAAAGSDVATGSDADLQDSEIPGVPPLRRAVPEPQSTGGWGLAWLIVPLAVLVAWQFYDRAQLRNSLRLKEHDRQQAERETKLARERLGGAARILTETRDELQKTEAEFAALQSKSAQTVADLTAERTRREGMETLFEGLWQKHRRSYVRNWQLVGPFAFPEVSGGAIAPAKLDLEGGYEGKVGRVRWKVHESDSDRINLDQFFSYREAAVCDGARGVYSDIAQPAKFSIGSDDGIVVWLNGEKVHENLVQRAGSPGQDRADVSLNRGWNEVLVRVDNQGSGEWNLHFEVLQGHDSKPLKLFSTHVPQSRAAEGSPSL